MLGEPGSPQDVKPHYALHCVLNHTLVVKDQKAREEFCNVLAAELSGEHSNYIKSFLCQTLQWTGHSEAVPALATLLLNEQLCDPAAMALVAIQDGAAEPLRQAWPQSKGHCRLTIIHSLAALADQASADIFKQALKDDDREVRIAAGAGLAALADARSADNLLDAADRAEGWERIQANKHCLILAEKLAAAKNKAEASRIYKHLLATRTDRSEQYIRQAAEKALSLGRNGGT